MKKTNSVLLIMLASMIPFSIAAQQIPSSSPYAEVSQTIGISEVKVTYSRPSVRGRQIWGGLVPYGFASPRFAIDPNAAALSATAPWRTGANMATTIEFSHSARVGGMEVKAGQYALFIAVFDNNRAEVILSSDVEQFGSMMYDRKDNVLSFEVEVKEFAFQEQLIFVFENVSSTSSQLSLRWEKVEIPFSIEFNTPEVVYQEFLRREDAIEAISNGNWYATAATYLMNNNVHFDRALMYARSAVDGYRLRSFPNLTTYANLSFLNGDQDVSVKLLEEAFEDPKSVGFRTLNFYGNQALTLKFSTAAIRSFRAILKHFDDKEWIGFNGLAKSHSQLGNFDEAKKYLKKAESYASSQEAMKVLKEQMKKLDKGKSID